MSSEASPTVETKPHRRWLQFSLRTLLLLMVPVACGAAWLGSEYDKGRRQKEAIAWVENIGGSIEYYDEGPAANWRRRVFASWFPARVRAVDLNPPAPALVGIDWYNHSDLSDLKPVAEFTDLQRIGFSFTQVSDLQPLAELTRLQEISAVNTCAEDLTPLANLRQLKQLHIRQAMPGGCDLTPLTNLDALERLSIEVSPQTDLSPLATLDNLRYLCISGAHLPDLAPLYRLNNLRQLVLANSALGEEEAMALKEAIPKCSLQWLTLEIDP